MSKIERIKAETDGLDVLPELLRAAKDGWETLSPEHVGLLKWYGLYAHNTGDGHFMMRVKVIQGKLSAAQVETMASIAEDFGRGVIDCTTRQCFQIHWIRLENIPEIFDRLEQVGMTTSGACGDITRNVVGCTVSGLAHDEIVDGYATSEAIHDYFLDNKLYSNLPRKYKVSVTGCAEDCARGLINDIALSAAIHPDGTKGFNLRVGGGLSHPAALRPLGRHLRRARGGAGGRGRGHRALPRLRREPEGARQGAAEVPRRPHRRRTRCARRSSAASGASCATASRRPRACRARTTSASCRSPTACTARSASSSRSAG